MTEYLLKIIVCSGVFMLVYFLFLEKEKMYRFNRFYLLGCILFSLLIPLITITIIKDTPLQSVNDFVFIPGNVVSETVPVIMDVPIQNNFGIENILLLCYSFITVFFLFRFFVNIYNLCARIRRVHSITFEGARIVLIEEQLTPHSFLNYIFLNKTAYENGSIEEEILYHELTHVKQHHTIDILFIELLTAFLWINPFIFLVKKAIKLNHEFLADEGVINEYKNVNAYQALLLGKTNQQSAFFLTSQFNFLITKKRLIMITKYTSRRIAIIKQSFAVMIVALATFIFSTKVIAAQEKNNNHPDKSLLTQTQAPAMLPDAAIQKDTMKRTWFSNYAGGTKDGVSPELIKEYHGIAERYKVSGKKWPIFKKDISITDQERLEEIFLQMSLSQQKLEEVVFWKPSGPLSMVVPTDKQFNSFKNSKIYGLWINDKKVPNNILNRYSAKDFSNMSVSKLYPNAKKGKSYSYQVDLMTNEYFKAFNEKTIADKTNKMVFQFFGPKKIKN